MNCEHFLDFVKSFAQYKINFSQNKNLILDEGNTPENFILNIEHGIKNCKIYEMEDEIKQVLILTRPPNKNDKVNFPFPIMFVDIKFTKEELSKFGIKIKYDEIIGIMLRSGSMFLSSDKEVTKQDKFIKILDDELSQEQVEGAVGTSLRITTLSREGNEFRFDTFNKNINITEEDSMDIGVHEIKTADKRAKEFIHKFVINVINFINEPEVEIIEKTRSQKNIERRKKAGKIPIPSSLIVKLTGHMKKYITQVKQSGALRHYGYRFWIAGHWRHFKKKKAFNKLYEKYDIGELDKNYVWDYSKDCLRKYIFPFVKGEGVLIDKRYRLVAGKSEKVYNKEKNPKIKR
jgi:hypothetical protein